MFLKMISTVVMLALLLSSCRRLDSGLPEEFGKIQDAEELLKNNNSVLPEPKYSEPGVVTVLLALGDQRQGMNVINENSSVALTQNIISYAAIVQDPKILLIEDSNTQGESQEDTLFIRNELLKNYSVVHHIKLLANLSVDSQLSSYDLNSYDLIWFNNPGHPMGSIETYQTLVTFSGGVILSGDDLSRGAWSESNLSSLTGLIHQNNGTVVNCKGTTYKTDNNMGVGFDVILNRELMAGVSGDESVLKFNYGNDIDETSLITGKTYEVLAYAYLENNICNDESKRPTIVRYKK